MTLNVHAQPKCWLSLPPGSRKDTYSGSPMSATELQTKL